MARYHVVHTRSEHADAKDAHEAVRYAQEKEPGIALRVIDMETGQEHKLIPADHQPRR